MARYRVYGIYSATQYLGTFEADTPEQAETLAEQSDKNHASLCHQCAQEIELDESHANSFAVELDD